MIGKHQQPKYIKTQNDRLSLGFCLEKCLVFKPRFNPDLTRIYPKIRHSYYSRSEEKATYSRYELGRYVRYDLGEFLSAPL